MYDGSKQSVAAHLAILASVSFWEAGQRPLPMVLWAKQWHVSLRVVGYTCIFSVQLLAEAVTAV